MPGREIRFPGDFINRKAEQEIFDNLVLSNDDAPLLVIKDKRGTGKSTLLEMLHYKCKYTVGCAVGSVQLDTPEINSPFVFIERLRESIGINQTFEQFDRFNEARVGKVASVFSSGPPLSVHGIVAAGQAAFSGASTEIIGAQVNYYGGGEWSSNQEEQARRRCIKAFFDDLKSTYDQTQLVILLDSYDRCTVDLKSWVIDEFVRTLCFVNNRPQKLLMVLAGRDLPDFMGLLQDRYVKLVRSSCPLSGWKKEHVNDFLRVHGYDNLNDTEVNIVWEKIQNGFSIQQALLLAEALVGG
ncbi:MAG TPA: hypothetical protein VFH46_20150 [Pyrinomonadaceae bacterium]|nr:hypothetical protein [Pyrinomonadaceae bacterium]